MSKPKPNFFQTGGKASIPVYDPNDPRLKKYQDSLTLYNRGLDNKKKMKPPFKEILYGFTSPQDGPFFEGEDDSTEEYNIWKKSGIRPDREFVGGYNEPGLPTRYEYGYKKPAQPYHYQSEPNLDPSKVKGPTKITPPVNVEGQGYRSQDLSQKPTEFSFTFPTFEGGNSQKTIYFKTKKALDAFTENNARMTSSEERADGKFATGYVNYQNGGKVLTEAQQRAGYNDPNLQKQNTLKFPAKFSGQFRFFTPAEIPVMATDETGKQVYLGPGSTPTYMQGNVTEQKMQTGGTARPSTSDSLNLYNNTLALQRYYKNYRQTGTEAATPEVYNDLGVAQANFYRSTKISRDFPSTNRRPYDENLTQEDYFRELNRNQFLQRETENQILDLRAPMALYDRRIQPTKVSKFVNDISDSTLVGDQVNIPMYDPARIKPYHLLTPEEKVQRNNLLGIPNEPVFNPAQIQGTQDLTNINIQAPGYQGANVAQQPTEFSFTYPTFQGGHSQKSVYFPDKKRLDAFLPNVSMTSSTETGTGKTATGYANFQTGGRVAIPVSDPNDPRLKKYNDSLSVYNNFQSGRNIALKAGMQEGKLIKDYGRHFPYRNYNIESDTDGLKYIDGIWTNPDGFTHKGLKPIGIRSFTYSFNEADNSHIPEFKKPAQPYVYDPEPNYTPSSPSGALDLTNQPNVRPEGYRTQDLSQKPTEFSFTFPTFQGGHSQQTIYFKTKKALDEFTASNTRMMSSQETSTGKTASGYVNYKKGGTVKAQLGLQVPDPTGMNFFQPSNNFRSTFELPDYNIPQQAMNQELNIDIPGRRKIEGFYQPFLAGLNTAANYLANWKREQDYDKYYQQNTGLEPAVSYLNKRQRYGDSGLPQAGLGMIVANEGLKQNFDVVSPNEGYGAAPTGEPIKAGATASANVRDEVSPNLTFSPKEGEDPATTAYRFFKDKGLSDHQAAGIVGNLHIESAGFSPAVISGERKGDSGKAVGVAQWHPDRWGAVTKYLRGQKIDPSTLAGQLEGVWYELNSYEKGAYDKLINTKSVEEAAQIFNKYYERSADKSKAREKAARLIYEKLSSFEEGGTYLMSDSQISELQKLGYKLTIS